MTLRGIREIQGAQRKPGAQGAEQDRDEMQEILESIEEPEWNQVDKKAREDIRIVSREEDEQDES